MDFSGLARIKVRILHVDCFNFSSVFHFIIIAGNHIFSDFSCRGGLYSNCTCKLHFATMHLCTVLKIERENKDSLCSRKLKKHPDIVMAERHIGKSNEILDSLKKQCQRA